MVGRLYGLAGSRAETNAYLEKLIESDLQCVNGTPWGNHHYLMEMTGHLIEHETHHRAELSLILLLHA